MPLELGIWRIDGQLTRVSASALDLESRLEDILDRDIAVANPEWMIVGRQVITPHGGRVDLLAIDRDGNLVIVELKRDHMPRDIVTQVLDYGSWVSTLRAEDIAPMFNEYRKKRFPNEPDLSIDAAFCATFGLKSMPEELNERHELVIVGSEFDPDTERIVSYLADTYGVNINAVFFRVFRDGDREYLTRAWLREPESSGAASTASASPSRSVSSPKGEWNGEYYISFGDLDNAGRSWEDAVKYGFVGGGGGDFYVRTLSMLSPGDRVWVNVPGEGYVGVGEVTRPVVRVDQFLVPDLDGREIPITQAPLKGTGIVESLTAEVPEHLVGVRWIVTVPRNRAIKEKGLFGNQHTVARPRDPKWAYTIERLKERFAIRDEAGRSRT